MLPQNLDLKFHEQQKANKSVFKNAQEVKNKSRTNNSWLAVMWRKIALAVCKVLSLIVLYWCYTALKYTCTTSGHHAVIAGMTKGASLFWAYKNIIKKTRKQQLTKKKRGRTERQTFKVKEKEKLQLIL